MNKSCLKHTMIPGTSRLFSDYLYYFDRVSNYYGWDPFEPDSLSRAAAQIQFPAERRKAITQSLREQNRDCPQLHLLEQGNGVAVVTGQQVGLFSGPAYTVYKAVTAARLAQRLNAGGIPAAAVFWAATEDHDLPEVDHAWVFDARMSPAKLQAGVQSQGGPAGAAVLEYVPIEQLARTLDGLPYQTEVVDMVCRAYRPGATLGGAFLDLLREVLRPLELLFLDPLHPSFRKIVAPFLAEAVERTPKIMRTVQERSRQLEQDGYHAQVFVDETTSPVLLLENGRRIAFKRKNGSFVNKHSAYSVAELASRGADISPNALLRPVMQDFALPTVAYVGGPAEIAYMAQCEPVYRELLGRMPVIVPRNSFTLLDEHSMKLLDRYKLEAADVLCPMEELRARVAQRLVPSEVNASLATARRNIETNLSCLGDALSTFDPTLQAALSKSATKIQYQLNKLTNKTAREIFRRDQQAARASERLANAIYPRQHLQERVYTILPFLAQHGTDLVSRLFHAAQLDCPDHMVRAISELN